MTKLLTQNIFILVISSLFCGLMIFLLAYNWQALNRQSQLIKNELASREQRLGTLRSESEINRDAEKITEQLKDLDIFVNPASELDLVSRLEEMANQHRLIQKIRLEVKNSQKTAWGGEIIPTMITLTGNYLDSMNYLQELERLNYQFNINTIQVINLRSQKDQAGAEMRLTGETYRLEF